MRGMAGRAAATAGLLCLAAAVSPSFPYPGFTPTGQWVSTLTEDFDGPGLNASLWTPRVNETHCEPCEPQLYVPSALSVADGSLSITTARAHAIGPGGQPFNFSSGWVDTQDKFSQLYGLFEARGRLPPQNVTGIWPAFWLMPNNRSVCWPTGGEVDVFEYTANPLVNEVFGSYRWGTSCGDDKQPLPGAGYPPLGQPAIDWSADYHVFAVAFNASQMTFFVDGVAYETKTNGPGPGQVIFPFGEMYIILNTAIAWYFPPSADTPFPCTTSFDFVRAFAWEAQGV